MPPRIIMGLHATCSISGSAESHHSKLSLCRHPYLQCKKSIGLCSVLLDDPVRWCQRTTSVLAATIHQGQGSLLLKIHLFWGHRYALHTPSFGCIIF